MLMREGEGRKEERYTASSGGPRTPRPVVAHRPPCVSSLAGPRAGQITQHRLARRRAGSPEPGHSPVLALASVSALSAFLSRTWNFLFPYRTLHHPAHRNQRMAISMQRSMQRGNRSRI
ncbi:hypothetical protein BDZ91DRAFT_309501 [Kalaharituber pfeilii]|nr:hypothetical protein BDZ91DRAFT_309501 [Kalaharituber pfeilii]